MRKKQYLALAMALAMAGATGFTSIQAQAAGLTQAADASMVNYGSLSAEDEALLSVLFDYEYYKENNPDIVAVLGDDYNKLLEHFLLCGIFEGRVCNPSFDPAAYASAYSDLKDVFGSDIVKYYEHYLTVGLKENRTLTTVEACAEAGITVESLVDDSVKVTPHIYALAKAIGTNDFATVKQAVAAAVAQAQASSSSSSQASASSKGAVIQTSYGTFLLVPELADADAYAEANGLKSIGTLKFSSDEYDGTMIELFIIAGKSGYALYEGNLGEKYSDFYGTIGYYYSETPCYTTKDYVASDYSIEKYGFSNFVVYNSIGSILVSAGNGMDSLTLRDDYEDYTGVFRHTFDVESSTDNLDGNSINISPVYHSTNGTYLSEDESLKATDVLNESMSIIGYYTNADGSEYVTFANQEEEIEWIKNKITEGLKESGYDESEYTITYSLSDEELGYSYTTNDNTGGRGYYILSRDLSYGIDTEGTKDTVYDVGANIVENSDGSLTVTIGVSSDENEFGAVSTMTIPAENTSSPVAASNNSGTSTSYNNTPESSSSGSLPSYEGYLKAKEMDVDFD